MNNKKGFTLIELLVVVLIIGGSRLDYRHLGRHGHARLLQSGGTRPRG